MKKKLIVFTALIAAGLVNAQAPAPAPDLGDDLVPKNRRGNEILPRDGDIGLGFNAVPVIHVLTDLFKQSTSSNPGNMVQYTSQSNNQITGKYFLDRQTAVRARLGINSLAGSITNKVQDANAMYQGSLGTADDLEKAALVRVEDKMNFRGNNIMFAVGMEKRRGYRRLQGIYGAELGVGNEAASRRIVYGNAFSNEYQVFYTNFSSSVTTTTVYPDAPGRTEREVETRYRGGFRIGVRGFVGIEYFVFTKISIAAEYGWGYSIQTRRGATLTREVYNNGESGPEAFTEEVSIDSREVTRGFSVDNTGVSAFSMNNTVTGNTALSGGAGALSVIFHF